MTIWIHTAGRPSNGAKSLSARPGFKRLVTGVGVKPGDTVVNWGSTARTVFPKPFRFYLNDPSHVSTATNKLKAFQDLSEASVKTVQWTTDRDVAQTWHDDNFTVVVRNKLTGHSGDGIVIIDKDSNEEVPPAPLYTKYVYKTKEFRIHVICDAVADVQRKIRDPDRDPVDWKVRSHQNGFVFARNNVELDPVMGDLAVNAVMALGLEFGAVDIVENNKGEYFVLEVNTAPGLEGQTVESYERAFNEKFR